MYARAGATPPRRATLRSNIWPMSTPALPPCGTPTYPTAPPSRAIEIAVRIDSSVPTASSTACAPTPPVSSRTASTAVLAALRDHVGGAELPGDGGADLVPAQRDDPVRAEPAGGQHPAQADRAVADHGDRRARADARRRGPRGGRWTSRRTAPAARSAAAGRRRRPWAAAPACRPRTGPGPPRPGRRPNRAAPEAAVRAGGLQALDAERRRRRPTRRTGPPPSRPAGSRRPRSRPPRRRRGTRARSAARAARAATPR